MATLAAFEAAARTGGFGQAAASLALTQSAVSRQIAALESWIGLLLFERRGRRVILTKEGEAYAQEISAALERVRNATAAIMASSEILEAVEIATLPTFGMRWLAPRLPSLMVRHPSMVLNFSARVSPFDFKEERFDGAIHFGDPTWSGAMADRLMGEEMVTVCSPAMAQGLQELPDLLGVPLLTLATRPDAWRRWLDLAGLSTRKPIIGPTFEHFMMMTQAAAAGTGVALAPRFLIEQELASGALVIPYDVPLKSSQAYYLVYPASQLSKPPFQRFRTWLIDTVAAWEAESLSLRPST